MYTGSMSDVVVIAHNIRSAHNVGSLLRTADGLGVRMVYITGYSPYPIAQHDARLPHVAQATTAKIRKTALGAELTQAWQYQENVDVVLNTLRNEGYLIAGLEQSDGSVLLPSFDPPDKVAIVLGSEVSGLETSLLEQCETVLEIPMKGQKESFNVVQAAAITLYHTIYAADIRK